MRAPLKTALASWAPSLKIIIIIIIIGVSSGVSLGIKIYPPDSNGGHLLAFDSMNN